MAKVCVIGLDGGTFSVIDHLIREKRLPNFDRLMNGGSRATLLSTIPPLTPAAWSSFFTGSNPGKTGAVGFFRFRPGTYQLEPMNAGNLRGETIWSLAGSRGKRVCVYNVPVTYPAAPVNGILISGMDAPSFDDQAIHPLEQKDSFLAAIPDFKISNDIDAKYLITHSRNPVGRFIGQLREHLRMELRTIDYLMGLEDWDLFTAVIRSTDSFQHVFWKDVARVISGAEVTAAERERAEAVFDCYETIDRELGDKWESWCSDRNLIFMSDHGFGELRSDVCLNRLLADAGLLSFHQRGSGGRQRQYLIGRLKAHLPRGARQKIKRLLGRDATGQRWHKFVDSLVADIDWSRTRIYAIAQHGCLYVNLKDRDPLGTVSGEAERQEVLAETEAALSRLRDPDDGEPVITEFYRKEELFEGPLSHTMPDMVINMRDWSYRGIYSTRVELAGEDIFRPQAREWQELGHTGAHRREGILMLSGPDIVAADLGAVRMVDVAPTIMALLELPPHDDWDGEALTPILGDGISRPGADAPAYRTRAQDEGDPTYSAEEEEEIRKRLENLGYL